MKNKIMTVLAVFALIATHNPTKISSQQLANKLEDVAEAGAKPKVENTEEAKEDNLYYNKGVLAAENKNYDEAIDEFTKAIVINSKNIFALYGRATVYYELGKKNEALKDLNKILKLNKNDEKVLSLRAAIYQQQNEYKNAIDDYEDLIKLNPNSDNYFLNLGYCYQSAGNKTKAIDDYLKAEKLGNSSNELIINLIGLLYEAKDYTQTLNYISKAYNKKIVNSNIVGINLDILLSRQECDEAETLFEKQNSLIDAKGEVLQGIANCYFQQTNYQKASELFIQSYKTNPELIESVFNSGVANLKDKKIDNALLDFQLFLDKTKDRKDLDNLRLDAQKQIDFFHKKNQMKSDTLNKY
jgi:tetratricopeptide (TPR) repeat protein